MAGCVNKTYKCGTKKTQNYEKVHRTTREESIFHIGNQVAKFEWPWGVPKFDQGPGPLKRRKIDQAMPYFQAIHSLVNLFTLIQ